MNKIIKTILVIMLSFGFVGCSGENTHEDDNKFDSNTIEGSGNITEDENFDSLEVSEYLRHYKSYKGKKIEIKGLWEMDNAVADIYSNKTVKIKGDFTKENGKPIELYTRVFVQGESQIDSNGDPIIYADSVNYISIDEPLWDSSTLITRDNIVDFLNYQYPPLPYTEFEFTGIVLNTSTMLINKSYYLVYFNNYIDANAGDTIQVLVNDLSTDSNGDSRCNIIEYKIIN